jgi:multicomponent Na+:H+ antiporter subunit B
MMRSLILQKVARGILPVTTLFALYLLLRGHNHPGGGFIAGLVTASALVLQGLAFGAERTRRQLFRLIRPAPWVGLAIAIAAGMWGVVMGLPFLTHGHWYLNLPGGDSVHLSTTLVFDIGVYMVVVGATAVAMAMFAEGTE